MAAQQQPLAEAEEAETKPDVKTKEAGHLIFGSPGIAADDRVRR